MKTRYTLVLGGGAHLGAVQAGQLLALAEHGIEVAGIHGCSVGALNGAYVSRGLTVESARVLVDMWHEAGTANLFDRGLRRMMQIVRGGSALSRPDRVRELVDRACPTERLEDFPIPLEVTTCNLTTGTVAYHRSGDARTVIAASCAMPGLLPPVEIDGARHVDGGVLDVLPWRRAVANSEGPVLVLDCRSGKMWDPSEGDSALSVLLDSFALARYHWAYEGIGENARIKMLPGPEITRGHTLRDAPDLLEQAAERTREWLAAGGLRGSEETPGRRWWRTRRGRRSIRREMPSVMK